MPEDDRDGSEAGAGSAPKPGDTELAEVCLLCKPGLQNRTLLHFLDRKLAYDCYMREAAALEELLQDRQARLYLLDMGAIPEALTRLSEPNGQEGGLAGSKVALMNVPQDADLEPYLSYSDLVGVLSESVEPDLLARGVQAMLAGELWFPRAALNRYLDRLRGQAARAPAANHPAAALDELTPKERAVLEAVGEGASNEAIARRMGVSVCTVKSHLHNIFQKLGVSNRLEAALLVTQDT